MPLPHIFGPSGAAKLSVCVCFRGLCVDRSGPRFTSPNMETATQCRLLGSLMAIGVEIQYLLRDCVRSLGLIMGSREASILNLCTMILSTTTRRRNKNHRRKLYMAQILCI